jgi:hypothetical protein
MPSEVEGWKRSIARAAAVLGGTLMLCWPAFWNGYPLLFPDSLEYLGTGHGISLVLRGKYAPAWMYTSTRSEIYSLGIFLLHRSVSLWPIAAAQALFTAWVVWLVVRSLCSQPVRVYLVIMALLSALTSMAWYASFIMPDILGPVLYLCIYLLVFSVETLRRWEVAALAALAWWSAASHATHLVLAAALGCLLALFWLADWLGMRRRGRRVLVVAGILLLTAGTQIAVHARLYGRPSLFGKPPAFLMARLIGDGPARVYLQQHCATIHWTICRYASVLPTTEGDFLWVPNGIWQTATPAQQERLIGEQMPLARATLAAYPLQQAARSWSNFLEMLVTMGPQDFRQWTEVFTPGNLDFGSSGLSARYPRTRQAHDGMPQAFFRTLQVPVIAGSALIVALLLPWCWRMQQTRLLGLAFIVIFVVPANAFLSGVISTIDARLQGRVVWLVALLAGLMVSIYLAQTGRRCHPVKGPASLPEVDTVVNMGMDISPLCPDADGWRQRAYAGLAIAAVALALCWPAFLNGFPLFFADSFEYLYTGWGVWRKLLGEPVSFGAYLSNRSEIYAAGIFLLDYGGVLWRIVAAQALLVAWLLWVVVRSLRRQARAPLYLTLAALLSVFTSVGWYVCYVMPDIFGSVLYLCTYLLVFAHETLRRWELCAVGLIAWWAAASHNSHLLAAILLTCLLAVLWLVRWQPVRRRGVPLLAVAGILLLTIVTQMTVHERLYGRPSLAGAAPPFLMARLLADGPARVYLQQHCSTLTWTICSYAADLPSTEGAFLWTPGSIWQTATPEQKLHLQHEQVSLALATLRAYPRQQIARSCFNFFQTLVAVGPSKWDFGAYPIFTPEHVEFVAGGASERYERSLEARNRMPVSLFHALQVPAIAISALIVALLLPWCWRRGRQRLLGLATVVLLGVAANAFVSGAISGVNVRYQGRVIWLLPLLAGLLVSSYRMRSHRDGALDGT